MIALEVVATGTVYGTAVWATHLTAGLVLDRTAAVERSWADGRAWVGDRRADVATAVDAAADTLLALAQHAAHAAGTVLLAAVCAAGPARREVTS